jgi:hypothetical protein
MIEHAKVRFANGNVCEVERVKFKSGGWIGIRVDDTWVYYPDRQIARVVSQ